MAQAVISLNAVDNTRAAFASVQKNIKQTARESDALMQQFRGVNFAKSILSGFGVGTGFGVLNSVMEKFVAAWKESGEYAKTLDEKAKSIADSMRAVSVAKRENVIEMMMPEGQIAQRKADVAILTDQLRKLEDERSKAMSALSFVDPNGTGNANNFGTRIMSYGDEKFGETGIGARDFYQMMQERADAAQQAAAKVRLELAATEKQVEKLTQAEFKRVTDAGAAKGGEIIKQRLAIESAARENRSRLAKATVELNEADEKSAEVFRMAADPLRTYRKELEELERIKGRISREEYKANQKRIQGDMVNAELDSFYGDMDRASAARIQELMTREARVNSALSDVFGDMDRESKSRIEDITREAKEASKAAHELGWAFASSFEDAILEGGKLSDVLRGLAKDILRIMIRNMITEPIAAGITGSIKGFFGGARAGGGPVASGTTYLVGENGPELFTPSSAGSIIPNHNLNQGSSAGGSSFSFVYNIAAGVSRAELMPALEATKRSTIAAIQDMRARSAGRAAYA